MKWYSLTLGFEGEHSCQVSSVTPQFSSVSFYTKVWGWAAVKPSLSPQFLKCDFLPFKAF